MMRIGLFTLDSVASNRAIRIFIERHSREIAMLGLSSRAVASPLRQAWDDYRRRGLTYLLYMLCNFALPRWLAFGRASQTLGNRCRRLQIPVYPIADINSDETIAAIQAHRVNLIVVCYFDQILDVAKFNFLRLGAVNVHTSLLPDNRGPMPVLYGMLSDPPKVGVTLHRIAAGIDTGEILAQKTSVPRPGDSVLRTMTDLHVQGVDLLSSILTALEAGTLPGQPQKAGTYDRLPDRTTLSALRDRGIRLVDIDDFGIALRTPIGV